MVIRKDVWNDFNFFEFTKARFMTQDMIYPEKVRRFYTQITEWRGGDKSQHLKGKLTIT